METYIVSMTLFCCWVVTVWKLLHSWPPQWSPFFLSAGGCWNLDIEEISTQEWIVWQSLTVPAPSSVICFQMKSLRQWFHWNVVSFRSLTLTSSLERNRFCYHFPLLFQCTRGLQMSSLSIAPSSSCLCTHVYAKVFFNSSYNI